MRSLWFLLRNPSKILPNLINYLCMGGVGFFAMITIILIPSPHSQFNTPPARIPTVIAAIPRGYSEPQIPIGITLSGLQNYNLSPGIIQMLENQIHAAKHSWYANTVRLQITQDRLVGAEGNELHTYYLKDIRRVTDYALHLGLYVVLNAQTEPSVGYATSERLPTYATHQFWKDMLVYYKNNTHVILDLFNEPRKVGWSQWYNAFQPLVNYIRESGARNTIWVNGLKWGSTLEGVPLLHGYGIVYTIHHLCYPWAGLGHKIGPENPSVWWKCMGYLAAKGIPVVDGEITFYRGGYNLPESTVTSYLKWLTQYHIGALAWTLTAGVLNGTGGFASIAHEPQSAGYLFHQWFAAHSNIP